MWLPWPLVEGPGVVACAGVTEFLPVLWHDWAPEEQNS